MMNLAVGLLVVIAVRLTALDLSGRWTLSFDPDFSGHASTVDCTFKQDDTKLTADCDGGTPFAGEIKDQAVRHLGVQNWSGRQLVGQLRRPTRRTGTFTRLRACLLRASFASSRLRVKPCPPQPL